VTWDGTRDRECPRNWSLSRKSLVVLSSSLLAFIVGFGSSIFAPASPELTSEFGVSVTVSRLSVSLWIIGLGAISGPFSDIFGHRLALAISMLGLCLFQLPAALATNFQTILISRTVAGTFGSSISFIIPRIYTDLYSPIPRSLALTASIMAFHLGTTIAPLVSAHLLASPSPDGSPPWRWLSWLILLLAGPVSLFAILFAIPETSTPILLKRKARRLRLQTGNWALHAQSEEAPTIQRRLLLQTYLSKPLHMLTTELLLSLFSLHLGIVHGVTYLILYAIPFAFQSRGWTTTQSHLPLLSVALGGILAGLAATIPLSGLPKLWRRGLGTESTPETRILPTMILGSVILPLGLVWLGWTSNTHWLVQTIAVFPIGMGCVFVLAAGTAHVLEVFGTHAESALAGHLVVRGLVSASFPLWVGDIYQRLGTGWASSVVALGCLLVVPVPVVFWVWGRRIREGGRY
ncbi:major facilitator superfamily domain-containing protein, partial [Cercophora newfieldiana]